MCQSFSQWTGTVPCGMRFSNLMRSRCCNFRVGWLVAAKLSCCRGSKVLFLGKFGWRRINEVFPLSQRERRIEEAGWHIRHVIAAGKMPNSVLSIRICTWPTWFAHLARNYTKTKKKIGAIPCLKKWATSRDVNATRASAVCLTTDGNHRWPEHAGPSPFSGHVFHSRHHPPKHATSRWTLWLPWPQSPSSITSQPFVQKRRSRPWLLWKLPMKLWLDDKATQNRIPVSENTKSSSYVYHPRLCRTHTRVLSKHCGHWVHVLCGT